MASGSQGIWATPSAVWEDSWDEYPSLRYVWKIGDKFLWMIAMMVMNMKNNYYNNDKNDKNCDDDDDDDDGWSWWFS